MILGVVGHEAAKFTEDTEGLARAVIRDRISESSGVVSGACHLGGIDIWAIEEANKLGLVTAEFPPKRLQWAGGYRERNIEIAEVSDKILCIVVKEYPATYQGMRFNYCYHCGTSSHVKSGGCWTAKYAGKIGKSWEIIEL